MRYQHLLPIVLALALGLFIGRATAPAGNTSPGVATATPAGGTQPRAGSGSVNSQNADAAGQRPSRHRLREEKKPSPDMVKRISVPLHLITKDLKEKKFFHQNYEGVGYQMDSALTMLGATDSEREKVKAVIAKAKSDILTAEKEHLTISRSDETGVELDTTGMKKALPGIIAATQSGIRDSLAPDIGSALNGSISWNTFYSHTEEWTPIKLAIVKGPAGVLIAQMNFSGGGVGMHLNKEDIPADGSPLRADRFFEDRWKPFLKDVMLVPVDPE